MLCFNQVTKNRTLNNSRSLEVLRELTFEINQGCSACLLSPSGGGKSTVLRLINRLEDFNSGSIEVEDKSVLDFPVLELRRLVGMVPQKPFLFSGTVYQNAVMSFTFCGLKPPEKDDQRIQRLMKLVNLDLSLLDRQAGELSVGETQRICIIRALLPEPRLLLLDEPTSALDPQSGRGLVNALCALADQNGTTILVATHDLQVVRRFGDIAFFMDEGRIIEQGRQAELLDHPQTPQLKRFLSVQDPAKQSDLGLEAT